MYAIIKTGGKQYRVTKGDVIKVEKIVPQRANQKTVKFDEVLLFSDENTTLIGAPYVAEAQVEAKIVDQGKNEKVVVFKYKSKKDYRRKQGHRQPYTELEITKVALKSAKKEEAAQEQEEA